MQPDELMKRDLLALQQAWSNFRDTLNAVQAAGTASGTQGLARNLREIANRIDIDIAKGLSNFLPGPINWLGHQTFSSPMLWSQSPMQVAKELYMKGLITSKDAEHYALEESIQRHGGDKLLNELLQEIKRW